MEITFMGKAWDAPGRSLAIPAEFPDGKKLCRKIVRATGPLGTTASGTDFPAHGCAAVAPDQHAPKAQKQSPS
jgi:hypothetical protein